MRILDEIEKELAGRGQKVPDTHWPSSASAWLPCDNCHGQGMVLVGTGDEGDTALCEAEECEKGQVLHGACMRAEYFRSLGIPRTEPIDPGGYLKMDAGNALEKMILDMAEKHAAIVRQVEVWVESDLLKRRVHGYVDALEIDPDGMLVPWEVKTSYGRGIKQVREHGIRTDWWLQSCLYRRGLRDRFPGHILGPSKIIAVGRDNFYRAEIDKPADEDTVDYVVGQCIGRWVALELAVDACKLPPAEYAGKGKGKKPHWRCSYCGWRTLCKEREDA